MIRLLLLVICLFVLAASFAPPALPQLHREAQILLATESAPSGGESTAVEVQSKKAAKKSKGRASKKKSKTAKASKSKKMAATKTSKSKRKSKAKGSNKKKKTVSAEATTDEAPDDDVAKAVIAEEKRERDLAATVEAKAQAEAYAEANAKLEADTKAKSEADAKAKANAEADAKAKAMAEADAKAKAEEKARQEAEEKAKQPMDEAALSAKLAEMDCVGDKAFAILTNLGMIETNNDPSSPDYDSSKDDEIAEGTIFLD